MALRLPALLSSLLLTLLVLAPPALAEPAPVFSFTAIPDADETRLKARFQKVADYLSNQLGVPVRYIPVTSYAAAVSVFRSDQVQLAWFGGLTGVRARQLVPGASAVAQGVEDTAFRSYIIAHASTGLQRGEELPEALRGMSLTFGSKSSTSGRLMPEYFLRQHYGEAPDEMFERVGFSGNHSRTIALVQSGAYQLGALNFQVWDAELAAGNIDTSQVRVIWESPAYPDYQWTARGDLDSRWGEGFSQRLTEALLAMKDPALLQTFPRSGFVPATNADYQPIADTARDLGLLD